MRHATILLTALGLTICAAQARDQVPAETRLLRSTANLPACDSETVLAKIASRFANQESYWNSTLAIDKVEKVRQTHFRPNGLDLVPRRYCTGVAQLSDRSQRTLSYVIVEDGGIIAMSYGVEFCVQGLDRNYAYAPNCQMARP